MQHLIYRGGSDLRVSEALGLGIQDIDFDKSSVTARNGKGNKHRVTLLSQNLKGGLRIQIDKTLLVQQKDNESGIGSSIPDALGRNILVLFANRIGCLFFRLQPLAVIQSTISFVVIICMRP